MARAASETLYGVMGYPCWVSTLGEQLLDGPLTLCIQEGSLIVDLLIERSEASQVLIWNLTLTRGDAQLNTRGGTPVENVMFLAPAVDSLERLADRFRMALAERRREYAAFAAESEAETALSLEQALQELRGVLTEPHWLKTLLPTPRDGAFLHWLAEQFNDDGLLHGIFADSLQQARRFEIHFVGAVLEADSHPLKVVVRVLEWQDGSLASIVEQQISAGPISAMYWNDAPPEALDAIRSMLAAWRLRLSASLIAHQENWVPFPHDLIASFPLRIFVERERFSPRHPKNSPVKPILPRSIQVGQWLLSFERFEGVEALLLQRKRETPIPILWGTSDTSAIGCVDGDTETARTLLEWLAAELARKRSAPTIQKTLLDWALRLEPIHDWRAALSLLDGGKRLGALKDARLYEQFLRSRHQGFRGALE
ncbi:MAG: hypothetical protein AAFV53_08285 [Myxococcota bacterium]